MNIFRIVHCVKSWFTFSCFFPAPLVIPRICYQSALTLCSRNVVRQFQPHIKNGRILFCANLWPSNNRYDILFKNVYFYNLYVIRKKKNISLCTRKIEVFKNCPVKFTIFTYVHGPVCLQVLFSYFRIFLFRYQIFKSDFFFVINFSYFIIWFLLNSSIVKSDNEIGKVIDKKNMI